MKKYDQSGRLLRHEEDGKVIYDRQEEQREQKKQAQAETLARLYEMGELSSQAIEKIEQNRPEVYQKAKDIVTSE